MKLLSRRKFVKLSASTAVVLSAPFPFTLWATPEKKLFSSDSQATNLSTTADKLLALANDIQTEIKGVAGEVDKSLTFCKSLMAQTLDLCSVYNQSNYYQVLRNNIYATYLNTCAVNFDSEVVPLNRFLRTSLKSSWTNQSFEIDSSNGKTRLVPDLDKTEFIYTDNVLQNCLNIRIPVKFISPSGLTVNNILQLTTNILNKDDSVTFNLVTYPLFSDADGNMNDPIDNFPVNSRYDVREKLISAIDDMFKKISFKITPPQNDQLAYKFALKNVVILNNVRLLSNASGIIHKNAYNADAISTDVENNNDAVLFLNPRLSKDLLSDVLRKNVKLGVPADFSYSISVNDIKPATRKTGTIQIYIRGGESYNWLFDDASVDIFIDSLYFLTFYNSFNSTNIYAVQQKYSLNVDAEGFPPIISSPDDAVDQTEAAVKQSMSEASKIRFQIPTPNSELNYSDSGGLSVIFKTLA